MENIVKLNLIKKWRGEEHYRLKSDRPQTFNNFIAKAILDYIWSSEKGTEYVAREMDLTLIELMYILSGEISIDVKYIRRFNSVLNIDIL